MTSPFPPVAQQHCGNCLYQREAGDPEIAHVELCCRYAPKPGPDLQYPARVPAVRWCGEWAPR